MGLDIISEPILVHDDGTIVAKRPGVETDKIIEEVAQAIIN